MPGGQFELTDDTRVARDSIEESATGGARAHVGVTENGKTFQITIRGELLPWYAIHG